MSDCTSQEERFWIVWCPQYTNPPRIRHPYLHEAKEEAKRLAALHPRSEFYVLSTVGVARTSTVTYTDVQPTRVDK